MQLTVLAQPVVNITKSGNKLGLHIANLSVTEEKSRVVRITIRSDSGTSSFLAKASEWVCIPSRIRSTLGIKDGQVVRVVEVKTIQPHSPRPLTIVGNTVDVLSLIPTTTSRGYRLYADCYEDLEPRLRIWYYHERGAARQIELKRYVNIGILGGLLGQLQAEGEKKENLVSFKNCTIHEHADFVSGLLELGLVLEDVHARCVFNPRKMTSKSIRDYAEKYVGSTGVEISSFDRTPSMKGSIAADTFVRSGVLGSILSSLMNKVRSGLIGHEGLSTPFLAKILTGDGSLDVRKTSKRLDVRVKIVDRVHEYLQDYAHLLQKEGFRPKVRLEVITVRSYCTWLNLLRLYEIGAFRNSRNWNKLLCAIAIGIKGRENSSYSRVQDLSVLSTFTSREVSCRYYIGRRAANLWLQTMRKLGLIQVVARLNDDHFIRYGLTEKGEKMVRLLESAGRDFSRLCEEKLIFDPERLLEASKTKSKGTRLRESSTEQSSQTC